jgi:hypothetical protein
MAQLTPGGDSRDSVSQQDHERSLVLRTRRRRSGGWSYSLFLFLLYFAGNRGTVIAGITLGAIIAATTIPSAPAPDPCRY